MLVKESFAHHLSLAVIILTLIAVMCPIKLAKFDVGT